MELLKVTVDNFRSIEHAEIVLKNNYNVLVGINEAGKSNILKAIRLLDSKTEFSIKDIREPIKDEEIEVSEVEFYFNLPKELVESTYAKMSNEILLKTKDANVLLFNARKINIKEFCRISPIIYTVNLMNKNRRFTCSELNESYQLIDNNLKHVKSDCPEIELTAKDGKIYKIKQYNLFDEELFHTDELSKIKSYYEDIVAENVNDVFYEIINKLNVSILPRVIYWEYKEENLLPEKVDINEFSDNPATCIPLKIMFDLAKIRNVKESINNARSKGANRLASFCDRISQITTEHLASIWKDYRDIKISIMPYGDKLIIGVQDQENKFNLADRSDGFKRFVTFLLLISAQNRTSQLTDSILIIDEPEIGLHITAQRYLRDELISISKNNYIFCSTHSIFMIDSNKIDRHFIVKRKNEKTTLEQASESNYFDEEVLFNALGFSHFTLLKESNIIFEGWKDKRLFEIALTKRIAPYKEIKTYFKNYGYCHSNGVKTINYISKIMDLANRRYIVLSDSDSVAIERKNSYYNDDIGAMPWYTIKDILPDDNNLLTAEDFIKPELIIRCLEYAKRKHSLKEEIPKDDIIKHDIPILRIVEKWIKEQVKDVKTIIDEIKNKIFDELKTDDINEFYKAYLEALILKIKA